MGAAAAAGRSALFVGPWWPDPSATGAGVRTAALLHAFRDRLGCRTAFLSPARENAASRRLEAAGVAVRRCKLNCVDDFAAAVRGDPPDVVVFDRFSSEEAFSWQVKEHCPGALRVLDMQDVHALRRWRQSTVEAGGSVAEAALALPPASSADLQRELAAVHRSDLALVCSPVELRLLRDSWGIPERKLQLASFFFDADEEPPVPFEARAGFVTVGTAMHPPNVDAIRWLHAEVWPDIRRQLPSAEIRIFGAHFDRVPELRDLHDPGAGFFVLGFVDDLDEALRSARVLLAPIRYGAGVKTKMLDSWRSGTPVVTTPVGAEGAVPGVDLPSDAPLAPGSRWGGLCGALDAAALARDAVRLHEEAALWNECQARGTSVLQGLFGAEQNLGAVTAAVEASMQGLDAAREQDFTGQMLWHSTARATEYFARWIEMKETAARVPRPG